MLNNILAIKIPFKYVLNIILGVTAFLTLAPYLAKLWWALELTCHFRVQYFIVLLIIFSINLFGKKRKITALAGSFALINLVLILPIYWPAQKVNFSPTTESIKIIYANVFTSNTRTDRFNKMIGREKPDIIVLSEINDRWVEQLSYLESEFIFSRKFPRADNFGLGLYSKIPLNEFNKLYLSPARIPALRATFHLNNQPITLLGIHPLPPVNKPYFDDRNEQLKQAAEEIIRITNPVILIGDFNTTGWSPYFRELIQRTGLKDSRNGFGLQPTWPTFIQPLLIQVDHCLVSPEIIIEDRRTGPDIGSDHYPIIVEVGFEKQK